MICVQNIEREDSLRPKYRCWVPTHPQQLAIRLQKRTVRTFAKSNADGMVAREIDDEDPLGFWSNGADVGVVREVKDESEAFKGYVFKETAIPQLGSSQFKSKWYGKPDTPELCGGESFGGTKQCTLCSA